jgi:hypothetical protein
VDDAPQGTSAQDLHPTLGQLHALDGGERVALTGRPIDEDAVDTLSDQPLGQSLDSFKGKVSPGSEGSHWGDDQRDPGGK